MGPGTRDTRPRDPGVPSKLKSETRDPLKVKKWDPLQNLKVGPQDTVRSLKVGPLTFR